MTSDSVGLRELRHHAGEVIGRVRGGATVDVTDRGRVVARIVPVPATQASPILDRLEAAGMLVRAKNPEGRLPDPLPSDGTDELSQALQLEREERLP